MENKILNMISEAGVVAVVRADSKEEAFEISNACINGGIKAIEVTYTVKAATEVIKELKEKVKGKLLIGAGTVLDVKTCEEAIEAGAEFIVSPAFDKFVADLCIKKNIPYVPGCFTITEMVNAMNAGAEVIKLFPGSAASPSYVKAVRGPLPNIKIMPTGGVSLDNVKDWIDAGCVAVGVGGQITAPAKNKDYKKVEENARAFVLAVKKARGE